MAMYPNATRGYMPFVTPVNKRSSKHGKHCKYACSHKSKAAGPETKTYRVTLRDRNGFTYTYIIQADGTKSLPVLCESKVTGPNGFSSSLPNLAEAALTGKRLSLAKEETTKDDSSKKGLFTSLLQYIRKRTKSGSSSNSKSKRKPKPMVQRKRQRTVSQMSNLDPIQESPEEDSEEDADSYTHDSVSTTSDSDSLKEHEP